MIRSLFTAATGMQAQQLNVDVISNNIANVNTVGFKRSRADFQDLLYQTLRAPGVTSGDGIQVPAGIQVGLGVKPVAVQKLFTQGDFVATNNDLDLVIEGDGFFQITMPDGTMAYTRAGAFKLDKDGRIVTSDGYPIEPAITIPSDATKVSITYDGSVSVMQPGSVAPSQIGSIEIARFINPAGLQAQGKNLFTETDSSGAPVTGVPGTEGRGTINQGFIEMSNVNVVEELANLIIAQRAFDLNSKAVQASDEMLQTSSNLKR
ncbi:MAG: flagellar basal-body rod protein FlgG [Nitrospirae bacterium]|nr:flagellar basal-body rod protein FlgG [Nitrospirota bacterium]MCL5237206.1 flagellar basal-body rod protein FlgG [Nitrospirota bacterium]